MKKILLLSMLFVGCSVTKNTHPDVNMDDLMTVYKNGYLKGYVNGYRQNNFDSSWAKDSVVFYEDFYPLFNQHLTYK